MHCLDTALPFGELHQSIHKSINMMPVETLTMRVLATFEKKIRAIGLQLSTDIYVKKIYTSGCMKSLFPKPYQNFVISVTTYIISTHNNAILLFFTMILLHQFSIH